MPKHLFIINPNAGSLKGKAASVKEMINRFATETGSITEIYETTGAMDACRKIIEESDKLPRNEKNTREIQLYVYACGGDGTLNECVNGAAGRENTAITHFPCGTGNDFLKTFSKENIDIFRNLTELSKGTVKQLDVIKCGYSNETGQAARYGINICSAGIDARVGTDVHKYSGLPLVSKQGGYILSLLVNVIKGVTSHFRIRAEDKIFDGKYTLACVCNGRYYGGGFNPVPDALADDGILECLVVEPVSRLQVAQIVGRYAKGRFSEFPDVFHYIRCTQMEIETDKAFVINVDGEAVYSKKVTFTLIPKGINFLLPACSLTGLAGHSVAE